jgi:putative tryptophan/tyrosine transport system substrate-binding protein
MRRIGLAVVVAFNLLLAPLAAHAQQRSAMPVLGVLHSTSPSLLGSTFLQGLREEGYVEGQNILIEYRSPEGVYDRLPALAAELVALRVTAILALGTPAARAAKTASVKVTPAIPVVFSMASDPVMEGFVASLNRPGGNITGVTSIAGALAPKRLDLIREVLHNDAAVAILINPGNPLSAAEHKGTGDAARAIGQRLEVVTASNQGEIEQAFATIKQRRIGALIIAADIFFYSQMKRLAALAAQYAVPAIGPLREFATEGGLLSYGASVREVTRQAGAVAGKVLKGAKPADLPVEQPTKFELVINLKTAKALGLTIPQSILVWADEVIQ